MRSTTMGTITRTAGTVLVLLLFAACAGGGGGGDADQTTLDLAPLDLSAIEPLSQDRVLQGGATTSFDRTALAFENPAPNLNSSALNRHFEGDRNFGAIFVSPPATLNPGLGPHFNNSSCEGCHTKNGRGQPVFGTGGLGSQAVLRLSAPDGEEEAPGGPRGFSALGTQLQDHATFGVDPEGRVELEWESVGGSYADGESYQLRRPRIAVELADGSALPADVSTSLRLPPPIFGLGLLEAVPAAAIEALADPDDLDGDGISGHANYVWDHVQGRAALGRFGRKANRANLLQQAAGAYFNDIGVTNPLFTAADGSTEIDGNILTSVEFYTQSLAVPAAAGSGDGQVLYGEKLFIGFKCGRCHVPQLRTASHPLSALSNQTIFAYTDLLLHDMGAGLADGRQDFGASGNEWRTAPLWGIGVTATILSSTATFLHDGRARTVEEAILWHAGEALESRERFRQSAKDEREALLAFLRSL